ncbi:tRNA lysidine(34) synthetase TilS [Pukyongiella litopenaei]|uniref:tRNA(Ile)-lysidine synthase n=1 Tax=Pukyongiella litopenaei TaxID=2605946 RepID=A0A2S0MUT5_9RHOB|nr:tRNA lysidine(34) synthetase TilS [Pukyongiella litopenaei]
MIGRLRAALPDPLPVPLGVAVSGGGDSVALLHFLTGIVPPSALAVATVDHRLRPESAQEAEAVAQLCAHLGLAHDVLVWEDGWDGCGNLQDAARHARYGLLAGWARDKRLAAVALGHTADDQAETVLMRLARASGVDGLSGMPAARSIDGVRFLRPLLGVTRAELRACLHAAGLGWVEDPGNENDDFDRIKARRALAALAPLGVSAQGLAEVAENLRQGRVALDRFAHDAARHVARVDGGDVLLDRAALADLPEEIARRLVIGVLRWVGDAGYPPRRRAVAGMLAALRERRDITLSGCRLVAGDPARICREYDAVRDTVCAAGTAWDGRWTATATGPGQQLRALGRDGLARCGNWRATGRPRAALLAAPSLWQGDRLVAAPLAGQGEAVIDRIGGAEGFARSLLSH